MAKTKELEVPVEAGTYTAPEPGPGTFPEVVAPPADVASAYEEPHRYEPALSTDRIPVAVDKTLAFLNAEVYQHLSKEQHDEFTKALKSAL